MGREGPVSLRKPKESGKTESVRKISFLRRVADMPNLCNDQGQWAGNMGKGECCFGFGEQVCQFITRKSSMTTDQGPTGSLELHWRGGSQKVPKYLRRLEKHQPS